MEHGAPAPNPVKVRQGLAIITMTVVVAIVLLLVIEAPIGKAVMFAVAGAGIIRAFLLARSLRSER